MNFKIPFLSKNKNTKEKNDYKSYILYNNQFHFLDYNDPKLAIEGFIKNIIVYRAITLITGQFRQCKHTLYQYNQSGTKKIEIEKHELLNLLQKPFPELTGAGFKDRLSTQYLIYGENYIQKGYPTNPGIYQNKKPAFLWPLRPDKISNVQGNNHVNKEYKYSPACSEQAINFLVKGLGKSNLMIMRKFNPQNDYHGLSPVVPAGYSIDTHNVFSEMTFNLGKNGAMPTGIMTVPADRELKDEEFERIKREMIAQTGPEYAGTPKLLEGGITWTQISIEPDKMMSNETLKQQAYNISLAWGIPMELLNQEQGKFTNRHEAYEQLYEDAVLPLTDDYFDVLNNELVPFYGDNLVLKADYSHTKVMQEREVKSMERLNPITFLSENEKRDKFNYENHPEGEGLTQKKTVDQPKNEMNARFIADEIKAGATERQAIELLNNIYGD